MIVIPSGLEPETPILEGLCSIQLSYGTKKIRKVEDGSVDIYFYDWRYLGEYLQTPIMPVSIHSRTIDIIIPQST